MNTTFNSLSTENKQQLLRFNFDYFFHYMLINSDDIRLSLCRYISGDDSIISTAVINDFEMQTGSISTVDEIHFIRYGDRLLNVQEKRGESLKNINDVFQPIFYR